eukprot:UN24600
MKNVIKYWKTLGCTRGILIYASENGRRIYERLGFTHENAMTLDTVNHEPSKCEIAEIIPTEYIDLERENKTAQSSELLMKKMMADYRNNSNNKKKILTIHIYKICCGVFPINWMHYSTTNRS